MAVAGLELYRLAGGTIVERWAVVDTAGLLGQLDAAVPSPAAPRRATPALVPA